jgi:hypothetical protein
MQIPMLIMKVEDMKAKLKDANAELKAALEDTDVFKNVLEATMEDKRYNVTEKMAAAHALKVALKHFTPIKE